MSWPHVRQSKLFVPRARNVYSFTRDSISGALVSWSSPLPPYHSRHPKSVIGEWLSCDARPPQVLSM